MSEEKSKKEIIAETFLKFFLQHGMVQTIINDVAKELHMSKKTIYKYFRGGKEECLYFIFSNIATESLKHLENDLNDIPDPKEKLIYSLKHIFGLAVPYVLGNAAEKEEDFLLENQIVGESFRDVFQNKLKMIIHEGIEKKEFHVKDVELSFHFIYGIITESMVVVHQNPKRNIVNEVTEAILKILK
ncbi:TetR/AcrR family transcriptional regulator [Candidatus Lokiarchaeum ossiferum]